MRLPHPPFVRLRSLRGAGEEGSHHPALHFTLRGSGGLDVQCTPAKKMTKLLYSRWNRGWEEFFLIVLITRPRKM